MSLMKVGPGKNAPESVNVVIEIPSHSDPVKYEVDKDSGTMFVDRFMSTPMFYPCNYGYIPDTLSEDGDPVDVLVITPYKLISGSVINCRPVAMLGMEDEAGMDNKLVAVPGPKLTPNYENINGPEDLPSHDKDRIQHFFEHYKDLEPGKWVKVTGWQGREAAMQEILDSIKRYKATETA